MSDPGGRTTRELLTDATFGPFFAANAVSNTGNWFQNVTAGVVVYEVTDSNTAVGAVSMIQFGATLLLTVWAGGLTDRVDRRWMLFTGQFIAFVGAAGLAAASVLVGADGFGAPWPIYLATGVIGLGAAISLPALQALVPALVPDDDLDRAVTLNSLTFNIARGVGPALAGVTVAAFGASVAFGINTLTFLPLLVVLALLTPRASASPENRDEAGSVRDGLTWVRERHTVLVLLAATLAVGWTSDPFSTLMPALAEDLGGGDTEVGFLVGSFGAGAAVTAGFAESTRRWIGRGRAIGFGLAVTGSGLVMMAAAPRLSIALLGAAVSGGGFLLGVTSTNTELQRGIPEALRGRVMAMWSVAFLGCRPLAALVDGVVADQTSVRMALGLAAAVAAAAAVLVWRSNPIGEEIRSADHDSRAAT